MTCLQYVSKYPQNCIPSYRCKIFHKFEELGIVKNLSRSGRQHVLDDDQKLDTTLSLQKDSYLSTVLLVQNHVISRRTIERFL